MNLSDSLISRAITLGNVQGGGAQAYHALDSQYTFGSAGSAIAYRFVAPSTTTLTDVYLFVGATAGTGNTISVALRQYSDSSTPGTLVTNGTATVASGTTSPKWVKATFATPPNVTENTGYYLVAANAAADAATNNFSLAKQSNGPLGDVLLSFNPNAYTTSNGWSTAGVAAGGAPNYVLKFGDGRLQGQPYSLNNSTASALEEGLKIAGLDAPLTICGVAFFGAFNGTNLTGCKIYSGSTGTNGSALLTQAFNTANRDLGVALFAPLQLAASTVYRVTLYKTASLQLAPGVLQIQDAGTYGTDLKASGYLGGNFTYTVDAGSGAWTDDDTALPRIALIVRNQVAASGAAASGNRPGKNWT